MYHPDPDDIEGFTNHIIYVPFRYRFCNGLLRMPCIGVLFFIFYFYTCMPADTSNTWFIGIIFVVISFFTSLLATAGTPIAFIVSLFFIINRSDSFIRAYLLVTLVAIPILACHYIAFIRLITGRYEISPTSGALLVNPEWLAMRYQDPNMVMLDFLNSYIAHKNRNKSVIMILLSCALLVLAAIFIVTYEPSSQSVVATTSSHSRTTSSTNIGEYYEHNYPETWHYLCRYAFAPKEYVIIYDRIWGKLQRYHGDGIPFSTLDAYEQSLVNYPSPGQYIYVSSGSKTYHNTRDCYTLLRSTSVLRYSYSARRKYTRCTKCVGD